MLFVKSLLTNREVFRNSTYPYNSFWEGLDPPPPDQIYEILNVYTCRYLHCILVCIPKYYLKHLLKNTV